MMKKWYLTAMIGAMIAVTSVSLAKDVSLESLLNEAVDRTAIARFPEPAFTCKQMSSYDRAMKTPDDPAGWFSNSDNNQFLRTEECDGHKEDVMFDAEGPGAVVRIWITTAGTTGNLRIYVDDMETPIVTGNIEELMGGEYGKSNQDAEILPWIAERARGRNCYFPIPYAGRCKITFERTQEGGAFYYQINYRTYAAGTKVESITPEIVGKAKAKISQVGAQLFESGIGPFQKCSDNDFQNVELTPVDVANVDETTTSGITVKHKMGPEAVRMLRVKLQAEDLELALRQTVLRLQFDSEITVEVPVGDFFGSGVGANAYKTWWNTVEADGTMTCYWPMPYKKTCHLELLNYGTQKVTADFHTEIGKWTNDEQFMYFHATRTLIPEIDSTEKQDMNYLMAEGTGVYAGDVLMIANPSEMWWGEGDEKVFVDGEDFPSHIGTGTEDYYGYAWGCPEYFTDPFHAQPRSDGPASKGNITNTRIRILDGIPFEKSLQFDMELWHWDQVQTGWASVAFWYAKPGATSNHPLDPETLIVHMPAGKTPTTVEDAIEGESLKIAAKTGDGTTEHQFIQGLKWSGDTQLWWKDGKPGDTLTVDFNVETAGTYTLEAMLTHAKDYGIVQLSIDGENRGDPIDLYHDPLVNEAVMFDGIELGAGTHTLTVEMIGTNENAIPAHMFGLDYLRLIAK